MTSPWNASTLAAATQGVWHLLSSDTHNSVYEHIVTDTRKVKQGDIFLALKGERFDAHDFLHDAQQLGAVAAIVQRIQPDLSLPQLLVADTRLALGHLGAYHRNSFTTLQVAALTGSSGKTTTKEMLGSIFAQVAPTLTTRGNLNNDLGVPMMLLELQPHHQYAVMELGANHLGEIDYTTRMVKPRVAGVLNIGSAHVGEFGGRAGIARAKAEIFNGLSADGVAIVPATGDFSDVLLTAASAHKTIRFGSGGDVYATDIILQSNKSHFSLNTPVGSINVSLPLAGQHNVDNALAATAFALAFSIPLDKIASGLALAPTTKGRLVFHHIQYQGKAVTVIDDTYNANPHSMRAAGDVLAMQHGYKLMIIGDMAELGDAVVEEQAALGCALAEKSIDMLFAVGTYAAETKQGFLQGSGRSASSVHAFSDKADAEKALFAFLDTAPTPVNILFKGSRTAAMETLLIPLLEQAQSC